MQKQKVIAIVGPTASGKTALGITLAKKLKGEVISADSRQIYRGMDIISGIPTRKEMSGIPHHMLRIADPKRQYSVSRFKAGSEKLIASMAQRGKVPIVVGGTGLYAETLLSGWSIPEVPPNKKLRAQLAKKTAAQLFAQLQKLDPERAASIDRHNPVRLIRAIEIAAALGKVPKLEKNPPHDVLWIGVQLPEHKHLAAIRSRIRTHLKQGALKEAARLRAAVSKKRYAEFGSEYQLFADCLDKKITKNELEKALEQWELQYAKRQMRWFKRNPDIIWVQNRTEALCAARTFLKSA